MCHAKALPFEVYIFPFLKVSLDIRRDKTGVELTMWLLEYHI